MHSQLKGHCFKLYNRFLWALWGIVREHCAGHWAPSVFWGIMPMWECASQKTTDTDRGHLSKTFWSRLRRYIPSTHRHITLHSCSYFDSMLWMFRHRKDNETEATQIKPKSSHLTVAQEHKIGSFIFFFSTLLKSQKEFLTMKQCRGHKRKLSTLNQSIGNPPCVSLATPVYFHAY